jgi:hypothetical protein
MRRGAGILSGRRETGRTAGSGNRRSAGLVRMYLLLCLDTLDERRSPA